MRTKSVFLLLLAAAAITSGCSRYTTRQGSPPILESLDAPMLPPTPIELEMTPPPAERALDAPGASIPPGTAFPARKQY